MSFPRFRYAARRALPGMPFIPITLSNTSHAVSVEALLDSGSTVSVLPYDLGLQLGLIWEEQALPTPLVGSLKDAPAWGVKVTGQVAPFAPVPMLFAWTQATSDRVPVLLGQVNFFQTFDVLFCGYQQIVEVAPRGTLLQAI